jgi:hypothetical protein
MIHVSAAADSVSTGIISSTSETKNSICSLPQTLDYGFFQDAPLSLINIETQTGMNELIENHSKFNFGTQTSVIDKTNFNWYHFKYL